TPRLRSFLTMSAAVASVASSVSGVRTSSTRGSTATGLKKWMPTTRSGWRRSAVISATDSDDVLVARTHSGETTSSSATKTSFLTDSASKTASRTRSQSANSSHPVVPVPTGQELAVRLLFMAIPLLERPRRGTLDQVERDVAGRRGAVDLVVELRPRAPHDLGRSGQVDRRAFDRLLRELERERDRFVHE